MINVKKDIYIHILTTMKGHYKPICHSNDKINKNTEVSLVYEQYIPCLSDLYEHIIAANRTDNPEKRMLKIKKVLHELPDHNFETFRYVAQHLYKVSEMGGYNKVRKYFSDS